MVGGDRGSDMSDPQTNDPPWLRGVYLREDFDFEARASAIPNERDVTEQETSGSTPYDHLLVSDDDFINSLTTISGSEETAIEMSAASEENTPQPSEQEEANRSSVARKERFPFSLPWLKNFQLEFQTPVTFLVGENGSGKSTLIEAIAQLIGFPVWGGGKNDLANPFGPEKQSELAHAMYPHFIRRPRDGYFFRAELYAQFASLLDERLRDPEFTADPYARYGGQSPHTRSHGESFLDVFNHRVGDGLYLLDEPESALSPQRQLSLLGIMASLAKSGKTQFIIATHSPILMTFPGATILSLDSGSVEATTLEETTHYQITRGVLEYPEKYWRHLGDAGES